MDRGHSPNSDELVMDSSQVVVGTSQKSKEAVGCQPIRTVSGGGARGVDPTVCRRNYRKTRSCLD